MQVVAIKPGVGISVILQEIRSKCNETRIAFDHGYVGQAACTQMIKRERENKKERDRERQIEEGEKERMRERWKDKLYLA